MEAGETKLEGRADYKRHSDGTGTVAGINSNKTKKLVAAFVLSHFTYWKTLF